MSTNPLEYLIKAGKLLPRDIPQELIDLLDRAAGKEHSKEGTVLTTLGQLLDLAEKLRDKKGNTERPDWDDYFLNIAKAVAARADCSRRATGAVIVKNRRIVSTGYNGTPPGGLSCLKGDCPRATMKNILHGSADYSNCISIHAEANAIAYANRADTEGATIYLTSDPCDMCSKLIKAAGIVRVVHGEPLNGTEAFISKS